LAVSLGRETIQRLPHDRHALFHHGADGACGFVREKIGDPNDFGQSFRIGEDLR
jgi:hypothetical protein